MTIRGIVCLVLALLVFAVQDAIVKYITETYEVIQVLTWRILFVVLIIIGVVYRKHGLAALKTAQWPLMCLRGVMAFLAFTIYYIALTYVPLGDAATVYMTAPLFVTAFSVPFLGEKVGARRWAAVCIGFAAVVYMLNPGADIFRPVSALPLLSALFYSLIPIITRKIDSNEQSLVITFYTTAIYFLLCALSSVLVHLYPSSAQQTGIWAVVAQPWETIDLQSWVLLMITSVLFTLGVVLITIAYRSADVSVLAPFEYSYLVWAVVASYLIFSDIPSTRTWIAASVIVASGIYIAFREHQAREPG